MKSKKLFAILTLVAFMMTLVPAFAFADVATNYSYSASTVKAEDDTIDVYSDSDDLAMLTLTFKALSGGRYEAVTGEDVTFYLKSSHDAVIGYVANGDEDLGKNDDEVLIDEDQAGSLVGQAITIEPDSKGKVYVFVGSYVAGEFTVGIYNGPADLDDENYKTTKLVGEADIDVLVGDGGYIDLAVDGGASTAELGDEITLTAELTDAVGNELDGETVLFKKAYEGGSYTTIAEVKTDKDGVAELDIEETRAGDYEYKVVLKSDKDVESNVVSFTWSTDKIGKIVAKTANNVKVALDEDYDLEFYIYDSNGNLIKGDDNLTVDFEVVEQPKNGNVDDEDAITDSDDGEEDGIITITINPNKVGDYEFKVSSTDKPSIKATLNVTCQEFGDAKSMKIELAGDQPSVVYGNEPAADGSLKVTLIDEDGVELDYTGDSELRYGSSNRDVVEVKDDGDIVVTDDEFIGEVTITVIDNESGVSGEYALKVVGKPVALNPVVTVNGKSAQVELQYVDKNGTRTYSGSVDELRLVLPSEVTSIGVEDFDAREGNTKFELAASKAGEYTIIANSDLGITKSFKVAFEVPASEKVVIGAKTVTMFIGNVAYVQDGAAKVTDVAPFIKDDRTFVAIRPVADAFGCEIGWDEATQTVTLTRSDITVTIVIGSSDILVVKDGVTSTVTADVPAFIQDGRTVLPFRAIGNAFGATVNYDAATQSVSYVQ